MGYRSTACVTPANDIGSQRQHHLNITGNEGGTHISVGIDIVHWRKQAVRVCQLRPLFVASFASTGAVDDLYIHMIGELAKHGRVGQTRRLRMIPVLAIEAASTRRQHTRRHCDVQVCCFASIGTECHYCTRHSICCSSPASSTGSAPVRLTSICRSSWLSPSTCKDGASAWMCCDLLLAWCSLAG